MGEGTRGGTAGEAHAEEAVVLQAVLAGPTPHIPGFLGGEGEMDVS